MIEQNLIEHLASQAGIAQLLASYAGKPAIFNQAAPADNDPLWAAGHQYSRIIISVDMQGDPERTMGGVLAVDILCDGGEVTPELLEPELREAVHGHFFSTDDCTVAAQWKDSSYFSQPPEPVTGCTLTFDLLAFPIITTATPPDVVSRFNSWSAQMEGVHTINHDPLPAPAWKPEGTDTAVYWRLLSDAPAGWVRDTLQAVFRTATVKGHVFAGSPAVAADTVQRLLLQLCADKRLMKEGESSLIVSEQNTADLGADPLRTGQLTVEATYGVVLADGEKGTINNLFFSGKEGGIVASSKKKRTVDPDVGSEAVEVQGGEVEAQGDEVDTPAVYFDPVYQEIEYTAAEIADNHKALGTYREIVIVALRQAGKETATFAEAKSIVEAFKNKEVK